MTAEVNTALNTVISPSFHAWKICGTTLFPQSFGRFARNYAETVPFHKISTRVNYQVKITVFCTVFVVLLLVDEAS